MSKFVVQGNITIDKDVTFLDGIFITNGDFNTSTNTDDDDPVACGTLVDREQLVINGAVYVFGQACFTRDLTYDNEDQPAEKINFEPKYLWLFQDSIGESKAFYRELSP